ncbi:STM4014 family protein [Lacipirellula parvula]|uniref:STM4014 family protein n=1 Tax=Lacipirellula parvula TaxID=2650471 RepID=UPI001E30CC15|nr:STM4014 family protein [Lacipirellula parvula]
MQDKITLVGNRHSRRVQGFVAAAARGGCAVNVVPYVDAISGRCPPPTEGVVRLDSPGEDADAYRAILRAGIAPLRMASGEPLDQDGIERLELARGAIVRPRQWFFGFREILHQLAVDWNDPRIRWMSTPAAVSTAFDKLACLERWSQLPTPRRIPQVWSYAELREAVKQRHARLFLKLRYGYAAMGAVALEWRDGNIRAITTVETCVSGATSQLYVSKRPQVLRREAEIAWLVDRLAAEELVVEEWLPKARWLGRPFDVRAVVIGGEVQHVVGRANASPFTNLNLDAVRISRDDLMHHLGGRWPEMTELCAAAARELPDAGMLGIDVLVRPGGKQFALLEANAFGDYLPGLLHQGLSTWDAEVRWLRGRKELAA